MAQQTRQDNGIDLDYFNGAIEAIRQEPQAGIVTSRVRHRWDDGFAVEGYAEALEQGGEVSPRSHTFRTDWPLPFGKDSGPTPGVESILGAVGACVATTYVLKAAMRGVAIDELEVITEGQLDLQGLLELDEMVCPRLSSVDVKVRVHSNASDEVLEELGLVSSRTSPTYDALANPVAVQLSVERLR
jgi:uncharacterized OsmC-like protein